MQCQLEIDMTCTASVTSQLQQSCRLSVRRSPRLISHRSNKAGQVGARGAVEEKQRTSPEELAARFCAGGVVPQRGHLQGIICASLRSAPHSMQPAALTCCQLQSGSICRGLHSYSTPVPAVMLPQ